MPGDIVDRPSRREDPGRRRGRRRPLDGRRVDGHRRVDAGDQAGRRHGHRRHHQPDRRVPVPRRPRSGATRCSRRSSAWWSRRRARKAPIQRLADLIAGYFVPAVVLIAVVHVRGLVRLSAPHRRSRSRWCPRSSVLIIACPCALGPGHAAVDHGRHRQGRRERHPDPLRRGAGDRAQARRVVLDKTGTITAGSPRSPTSSPPDGVDEAELLRLAAVGRALLGAPARRGDRRRRRGARRELAEADGVRLHHRQGHPCRGRGPRGRSSATERLLSDAGIDAAPLRSRRSPVSRARARRRCSWPSSGRAAGVLARRRHGQAGLRRSDRARCAASASRS